MDIGFKSGIKAEPFDDFFDALQEIEEEEWLVDDEQLIDDLKLEVDDVKPTFRKKGRKPKPKDFECGECQRTYEDHEHLLRHKCGGGGGLGGMRAAQGAFRCALCGQAFPTRKRLSFHRTFHQAELLGRCLKCKECPAEEFASEVDLYDHLNSEHNVNFKCLEDGCQKEFHLRSSLRAHGRIHGKRRYHCEECGKQFYDMQNLKEHNITHLKIKPFQCHICLKFVNRRSRLRMHLLAHESRPSSNSILSCKHCHTALKDAQDAEDHVKTSEVCRMSIESKEVSGIELLAAAETIEDDEENLLLTLADQALNKETERLEEESEQAKIVVDTREVTLQIQEDAVNIGGISEAVEEVLKEVEMMEKEMSVQAAAEEEQNEGIGNVEDSRGILAAEQHADRDNIMECTQTEHTLGSKDEQLNVEFEEHKPVMAPDGNDSGIGAQEKHMDDDLSGVVAFLGLDHRTFQPINMAPAKIAEEVNLILNPVEESAENSKNPNTSELEVASLTVNSMDGSEAIESKLSLKDKFKVEMVEKNEAIYDDDYDQEDEDDPAEDSETFHIKKEIKTEKELLSELTPLARIFIEAVTVQMVYRCEYCEMLFSKKDALNSHRMCHDNVKDPFTCNICHASFSTYGRCKSHKTTHGYFKAHDMQGEMEKSTQGVSGYEAFPVVKHFLCQICNKTFLHWTYLQVHRRHKHTSSLHPFTCKLCGDQFMECWMLNHHRRKMHADKLNMRTKSANTSYKCADCDEGFNMRKQLAKHRDVMHGDNSLLQYKLKAGPFACTECEKVYQTKVGLEGHMRVHNGGVYLCALCGNGFAHRAGLDTHHKRVHLREQRHPCPICGQCFFSTAELDGHKRCHTGEKPFPCSYCPMYFRTKGRRNEHHRIHTGERPYPCDICGLAFRRSHAMKNHRLIHTGERQHRCPHCSKLFHVRSNLNTHMKQKHPGQFLVLEVEGGAEVRAALEESLKQLSTKDVKVDKFQDDSEEVDAPDMIVEENVVIEEEDENYTYAYHAGQVDAENDGKNIENDGQDDGEVYVSYENDGEVVDKDTAYEQEDCEEMYVTYEPDKEQGEESRMEGINEQEMNVYYKRGEQTGHKGGELYAANVHKVCNDGMYIVSDANQTDVSYARFEKSQGGDTIEGDFADSVIYEGDNAVGYEDENAASYVDRNNEIHYEVHAVGQGDDGNVTYSVKYVADDSHHNVTNIAEEHTDDAILHTSYNLEEE